MFIIKDGTGTNQRAKVDANNDLHVRALASPFDTYKTSLGQFFSVKTGFMDITSTGGRVLWLYYTETVKDLAIARLVLGWNGGDTNHNRACEIEFVVGDTLPTTNTTSGAVYNANTIYASTTASATTLLWDGVGDGMTGHTPGVTVSSVILAQGTTVFDVHGTLVVGPGATLSINARGEEAGRFSYTAWFYLVDPADQQ